jgi:hypothetical protein
MLMMEYRGLLGKTVSATAFCSAENGKFSRFFYIINIFSQFKVLAKM